jgi:hypothetical protein
MTWIIIATACMLNDPSDCWSTRGPQTYHSLAACLAVLDRPMMHIGEVPAKVMGSEWVDGPTCVGRFTI